MPHTDVDPGSWQVEPVTFSMAEYDTFVNSIQDQVVAFKQKQAEGTTREEARCADFRSSQCRLL